MGIFWRELIGNVFRLVATDIFFWNFLAIFVNHSSLDDIPLTDNKCNVFLVKFDFFFFFHWV